MLSSFHFSVVAYTEKETKKVPILFPGQSDLAAYPLKEKGIKSALAACTQITQPFPKKRRTQ